MRTKILPEESRDCVLGERPAEQEALSFRAASLGQPAALVLGLDPFRGRLDAEIGRQADHGGDDRGRIGIATDVGDKRHVDLDLGEGKRAEIAEGGIAGAGVVERDVDAELIQGAQFMQRDAGRVTVEERRLGHLDVEPAGQEARVGKDAVKLRRPARAPCVAWFCGDAPTYAGQPSKRAPPTNISSNAGVNTPASRLLWMQYPGSSSSPRRCIGRASSSRPASAIADAWQK